jgi:hypothetical protein
MSLDTEKWKALLPLVLILLIIVFGWLGLQKLEIIPNIGLICFAIFKIYASIKKRYYKQMNINFLLMLLPVAIILLSCDNLLRGKSNIIGLIVTLLMYTMISNRYIHIENSRKQEI